MDMSDDDRDDREEQEQPFDGMPQGFKPRPCDKCGAGNLDYTTDGAKEHPLCREVQLAFGLVAWLCMDCRKAWHKHVKNHPLNREYMKAQMKLEFWKARISPASRDSDLDEGTNLLLAVDELELQLNDEANKWLIVE